MMKYLQKLGKALMLPVACLPICGILMGIGYALCPSTMQGGDMNGFANMFGFFLVKAGGALVVLLLVSLVHPATISSREHSCQISYPSLVENVVWQLFPVLFLSLQLVSFCSYGQFFSQA